MEDGIADSDNPGLFLIRFVACTKLLTSNAFADIVNYQDCAICHGGLGNTRCRARLITSTAALHGEDLWTCMGSMCI